MSKPVCIRFRDPKLWKDFQDFVLNKYGTKHTVLAVELEKALYSHLCEAEWPGYEGITIEDKGQGHQATDTHTKRFKPREERFLKAFYIEFSAKNRFSDVVLNDFIRSELGVKDWRTVRAWKQFLKAIGWIKYVPMSDPARWDLFVLPETYDRLFGGVELKS